MSCASHTFKSIQIFGNLRREDCLISPWYSASKIIRCISARSGENDVPEVVEFYRLSGDVDYLPRVVLPDVAAYDAVCRRL
jgi:DNA-binding Lrp family transcriptional regulator